MSYAAYRSLEGSPVVINSATESEASGLVVGRLDLWPPGITDGHKAIQLIQASECDLVVVRHSADDVRFAAQIKSSEFISWQADTLLYYSMEISGPESQISGIELDLLGHQNIQISDSLIGRTFSDYRNHYSSNPLLSRIDVVAAYQDWTRACLNTPNTPVFRARDQDFGAFGICVLDETSTEFTEILLAGVVPEARRLGLYSSMFREVIQRQSQRSIPSLVISTQAANIGVIRAWSKIGLLPVLALNTVHVMRRESFENVQFLE